MAIANLCAGGDGTKRRESEKRGTSSLLGPNCDCDIRDRFVAVELQERHVFYVCNIRGIRHRSVTLSFRRNFLHCQLNCLLTLSSLLSFAVRL